jgi:ABC-type transport system involved in multi-copper enzyme maturation permease subunit
MRPYLAIIKDSFREALASRILYIMLGLITVLLLLVAPLTYRQELTVGLHDDDANWPELIEQLKLAEKQTKPSPTRRIWTQLTPEQQKTISELKRLPKQPKLREALDYQKAIQDIVKSLDEVARKSDLYDRPSWASASLTFEGRQLVGKGTEKLDELDKLRLNRILFEAAFPGLVRVSPRTSFQLRYSFVSDILDPLPITKGDFRDGVAALLPFLIDKILLGVGLLVAIVITSPMIPQTFDPGSLHLLLSKPIGRSLLYLTKFLGGCAFVVVCATYLFLGLWLIAGTRWGIWEPRIMLCVPIYTFVFATYYSVASLAGALWRNSIVSILVAAVFWLTCFGTGWAKIGLEWQLNSSRITRLVAVQDQVLSQNSSKTSQIWDDAANDWVTTFQTDEQKDLGLLATVASGRNLGPVYDPRNKQLVGVTMSLSNGQFMVVAGNKEGNWKPGEGPPSPISAAAMLNEPDGTPVIISNYSLQRITGAITPAQDKVKFLGYTLPSLKGSAISDAGPRPAQSWGGRFAPAIDAKTGLLVIYNGGEFTTLSLKNGRYEQVEKKRIWEKDRGRSVLAATGGTILLGKANGKVVILDSKTLETKETLEPEAKTRATAAAASADGKWIAVLMDNRKLWLYDVAGHKLQLASVTGQGDISAVAFTGQDLLLVADRTDRVLEYSAADMSVQRRIAPAMSVFDRTFRYGIMPIYTICPKPGELYKTVTHILSDAKQQAKQEVQPEAAKAGAAATTAADEGAEESDDAPSRGVDNPWSPVWSSAIFMAVMLALGCAYMQWQEF